ncbi:2-hydroxy-3-oxopropionate reductase [Nesterenkonia rhizosphaerae]|uniref:2-hydroxy-3-oxopropionate reductase n=1 Tax=Nesterenkonia rhizosphaerae TaxID=1348272 RepID=A0ABP9FXJ8_9MICC
MSQKIAFIGLGVMGAPMAANLQRAGFDVTGYNRSPGKAAALLKVGGREASSAQEAVQGADFVLTMLPDSPDIETVVLDEGGVLDAMQPGARLIDLSTIAPETARRVFVQGREKEVPVLDAPVSGGEQGAIEATLSIMVGGERSDFEVATSVLGALGKTVTYLGPAGAGQTVKAANQLIVAGTIELVAEALTFLDAHGVQLEDAVQVLQGGLAGSTVLERKGPAMLGRSFEPGFRIDLHHKDLGIYSSAVREAGVASPLGQVISGLMASARAQGLGSLDHSALLLQVEKLSGHAKDQQ